MDYKVVAVVLFWAVYLTAWWSFGRKERKAIKTNPKYIVVTPEDIANGVRHSKTMCPIANAITRQFAEISDSRPRITKYWVGFWDKRGDWLLKRPTGEMRRFIERFDAGKKVEPSVFRIAPLSFWERTPEEQLKPSNTGYQDSRS